MAHTATKPPSPELKQAVRELVEREGVLRASQIVGLGRETLTRIVAGLDVRRGSIALAERQLGSK